MYLLLREFHVACSHTEFSYTLFFYYYKYVYAATPRPRERFENANICILQETVGSHLKPSLPVVVMATLNLFNSNLFVVSVINNSPLPKISQYIVYIHNVASTPC